MNALDLSGLECFKASDLLSDAKPVERGDPLEVDLNLIDFDPKQPRRNIKSEPLAELADSIKVKGRVLEPVSLRSNPDKSGRYIINRGERRVRASRMAGMQTVRAFIEEYVDRFAQVIENIQREDLSPFDLATFIEDCQAEDPKKWTLSAIAKELGKPRSFITETAELIAAPLEIRQAFDNGRIRDTRSLYLLVRAARENQDAIKPVLEGTGHITRDIVEALVRPAKEQRLQNADDTAASSLAQTGAEQPKKLANAILVEYQGRRARLGWTRQPTKKSGEIVFEDGDRKTVPLADLKLVAWTMR